MLVGFKEEYVSELLQTRNPKDPRVRGDNYQTRQVLLQCPGGERSFTFSYLVQLTSQFIMNYYISIYFSVACSADYDKITCHAYAIWLIVYAI